MELEWQTRRDRIDRRLKELGWSVTPFRTTTTLDGLTAHAVTEFETANGPADYALVLNGRLIGIIEAKRRNVDPENVLCQAERYARGLAVGEHDYEGIRAPFLWSSNGSEVFFRDCRHPLNLGRAVADYSTPEALCDALAHDQAAALTALRRLTNNHPRLRPYQIAANTAVETALHERRREMLVAMATGTGKTFTTVNQIYRFLRSGTAKRILFLVDRRALAAQAVQAFNAFRPDGTTKFTDLYQVFSQRFRRDDLDEANDANSRFDPQVMPSEYLLKPQAKHTFVYVCTVQRMAMNLFGRAVAQFANKDEAFDDDAEEGLGIPIHAFDVVIADECHRGYTAQELSVWRDTLEHFDAVRIGLTATPAAHTLAYFKDTIFEYGYRQAVQDGYLVDYDAVKVQSGVRINGVFLSENEAVRYIDPETGQRRLDRLEAERQFDASAIEREITVPDSNRKVLEEVKKYAEEHESTYGRFPKTLIFAVNDQPFTSHAQSIVELCRQVFGRGEEFVSKITGTVDRPLQEIKKFRNRPNPGIVVSVDLMATGVDIPDLEFIVFLRPVKSRILFEQMLGRGTRKGFHFPDKSHFVVFDCFGGTLLDYFKTASDFAADAPTPAGKTIQELVEDIWQNRDRDYATRVLVKRLHRIDKEMSGQARDLFAAYISEGDLARFASALPGELRDNFNSTMTLLRNPAFQDLLQNYPRAPRTFIVAEEQRDTVTSEWLIRDGMGNEHRPEEYLAAFQRFVAENSAKVAAIEILLRKPRDWSTSALQELRDKLAATPERFTVDNLQRAHDARYRKALVDIISMVKHAADEHQPLFTARERVERAVQRLAGIVPSPLTRAQQQWLDRIKDHLVQSLSIERDDFEVIPVLANAGGWGAANRAFDGRLDTVIRTLNEAIAA
ncbi:MAG: DEAD/DEAH box helicase [Phycisphaerae bacterium]